MSENAGSEEFEPGTMEGLFAVHEGPLLRYAQKLVKNLDISQEIVQEAFMKLHAQFDNVRQPRPWLYRTAHNLAMNHLRSGKKIVSLDFEGEGAATEVAVDEAPLPDEQMERREAIERTRSCLATLDERGRELIRLKFEEGLSYKEISKKTGLSDGNVGYILHHALKELASKLESKGVRL